MTLNIASRPKKTIASFNMIHLFLRGKSLHQAATSTLGNNRRSDWECLIQNFAADCDTGTGRLIHGYLIKIGKTLSTKRKYFARPCTE